MQVSVLVEFVWAIPIHSSTPDHTRHGRSQTPRLVITIRQRKRLLTLSSIFVFVFITWPVLLMAVTESGGDAEEGRCDTIRNDEKCL